MIAIRDRVRYVETDMMNVVHHSNYLRWFEMARIAYFRKAGIELWDMMNEGMVFPITQVEIKYKNPAVYDDVFEVQATLATFSRAKMDFTYKVIRVADGLLLAEGRTRSLFTDREGKILRLSGTYLDKLSAMYAQESKAGE